MGQDAPTWWPDFADFETRSRADLKAIGGRNYWAHPSTEVVCCVFWSAGEYYEWTPGDPAPPRSVALAAHNAIGFDRHGYERLGWPMPERWIDTAELARSSGLPGKLETLGERMGLEAAGLTWYDAHAAVEAAGEKADRGDVLASIGVDRKWLKDKAGNRFTLALSQPSRAKATMGQLPPLTKEVIGRVLAYCRQDVALMVALWPWIWDFDGLEPEVLAAWRASNDRGVCLDTSLCRALLDADANEASRITGLPVEAIRDDLFLRECARLGVKLPKKFSPANLRKIIAKPATTPEVAALLDARLDVSGLRHAATFTKWVREAGGHVDSAEYENVEPLTRSPIPAVAELATARLAVASIASGKLRAGLNHVSADGRMRDNVRYYGAHTGRGSGGGMQLQNFPRPEKPAAEWDDDRVCAECESPREWNQNEIGMLLRACIKAPEGKILIAADFSAIEARATAWAAGDEPALELFRSGADVYLATASEIFQEKITSKKDPRRQAGKVSELACGYGGGVNALQNMARPYGVVFEDMGVDPQTVVDAWRALHAPIVQFWHDLERAAVAAVDDGREYTVGAFRFDFVGRDLAMLLPSGRPIVYRNAELVPGKYGPQIRFLGSKGPEHTYGGKLCENGIQGACRCLMTDAMVRCEAIELPIVLSVHDELVAEVEADLVEVGRGALNACMVELAPWAAGMPVTCEVFQCLRYRK